MMIPTVGKCVHGSLPPITRLLVQRQPCKTRSASVQAPQAPRERPFSGDTWCTCQGVRRRAVSSRAVTEEAQDATESEALDATEDRLESVKIEEERQPNSHIELTVTIPARRCAKAWQRALRQAGNKLNVPGFRKGKKIPEEMLFEHVSKRAVVQEAVQTLLRDSFPLVTQKYTSCCYGNSLQVATSSTELLDSFSRDRNFVYKIGFDVEPELKWTGDYKKLKVEVQAAGDESSDKAAVDQRIAASIKDSLGTLRVVSGRGLAVGDVAMLDYEARIADNGEPIAGSKKEGLRFDTEDPERLAVPGLLQQLLGMRTGETKTFSHEVPDAWWETDEAVTSVESVVTLKELFQCDVPELTDEVAKKLLPACAGVEDLRRQMLEAQSAISAVETANRVNEALTLAVSGIVDVDVPESMIQEVATNEYQAQLLEMQARGAVDAEALNELATEAMLHRFIEHRREALTQIQRGVLGFEEIFKLEGMSVTEEELRREADQAKGEAAKSQQELDEEKLLLQVQEVLKATKVLQWLTDHAEIKLLPPDSGSPAAV